MQTSISKRLLAGLLSIVMVLSLFVATPAKTEAGRESIAIVNLTANPVGKKAGSVAVANVDINGITIANYQSYVKVNNGKYTLDPDDSVGNTVNELTITMEPVDMTPWNSVKQVQVRLGATKVTSNNTEYELATFEIKGNFVVVKVKTSPYDTKVNGWDVAALKTPVKYGYAFPTELWGFNVRYFNHGVLTWSFTENDGASWTYPSLPVLNKAEADGAYYRVETILSAVAGIRFGNAGDTPEAAAQMYNDIFELADYTDAKIAEARAEAGEEYDELVALYGAALVESAYGTKAEYMDRTEESMREEKAYIEGLLNGREFKITDVSKDGKTCKLTISKIKAVTPLDYKGTGVTSIEMIQEMNFATSTIITPADAIAKMPTSFFATIGGQKKEIEIANLKTGRCHWHICTMSGGSLVPMDTSEKFVESDLRNAPANYYYAVLVWDTDWDEYHIGNNEDGSFKAMKPLHYALFYENATDEYGVIDRFEKDMVDEFNDDAGWIIKFTVNAPTEYGTEKRPTEAFRKVDAPMIEQSGYNGYTNECSYYVIPYAGNLVSEYTNTVNGAWNDAGTSGTWTVTAPDDVRYFRAYTPADYNAMYIASPVTYKYFAPKSTLTTELKQGAVSITMQTPEADATVERSIRSIAGDMDFADSLDFENVELYWSDEDEIVSGYNAGGEWFDYGCEYTADILVPVKPGYKISAAPQVRVNGNVATAVELLEDGYGTIYIHVTYEFPATGNGYSIFNNKGTAYCAKPVWSDLTKPYAGCVIPKKLTASESSSRFYEFIDITWYENGVDCSDKDTFELGKRYTAVVTWNTILPIKEDCAGPALICGDAIKNFATAKAIKSSQEVVITYEFPAVEAGKIRSALDIDIDVPNGMAEDAFYNYVLSQLYAVVTFEGGATGIAKVAKIWNFATDTFVNIENANTIKTALEQLYPGVLGYDSTKKSAQEFTIKGAFNAVEYGGGANARVNINIHVAGVKNIVGFNANGGTYTGADVTVEQGKEYGFKYVPSQIYRDGYFFAGWYTAATEGTRVKSTTIYDGKVKTLYAHWVKVFTGKVWTVTAKSYAAGRLTVTAKKPATKVDGYEFSYSMDGVNWTTFTQTKNVAYLTNLQSKGTYFVKVRAYRIDSAGKFVYGAYSTNLKATAK